MPEPTPEEIAEVNAIKKRLFAQSAILRECVRTQDVDGARKCIATIREEVWGKLIPDKIAEIEGMLLSMEMLLDLMEKSNLRRGGSVVSSPSRISEHLN